MACEYLYNGTNYKTYQDLVDFLMNSDESFLNDFLFSRQDMQDAIYDKLNQIKATSVDFSNQEAQMINGGPDLEANSDQFTTQTFIDSNYFMIDGKAPMFKLSPDAYVALMKQRFVDNREMTVDDAEAWGENIKQKWKDISDNALDFHKMILAPKEDSLYEWGQRTANTAFANITEKVMQAERDIFRQVMLRNGRDHRVNGGTGKLIKNLNLETKIRNMAETLLGHIDYVVVRDNGDIELFNVKTSIEPHSQWASAKVEKYKYQLALLKQMLAYHGIDPRHIRSNIIPVQLKYNDTFDSITDIYVQEAQCYDMQDTRYTFQQYDSVAAQFIDSTADFSQVGHDALMRATTKLQHIFGDGKVAAEGIRETAKDWIKNNWKYCKPEALPNGGGYQFTLPQTGETITVSDTRKGVKNEEFVRIIEDRLNDTIMPFAGEQSAYRIRTDIANSFRYGFYDPAKPGPNTEYLQKQFSKYLEDKKIIVNLDGTKTFEYKWELVDSPALDAANIIALRNKETGQLDVFTISGTDPNTKYSFKGRKNLMGYHISDMNKFNFLMECNYGNMEAVRTLTLLNEVLPDIGGVNKLGRLTVMGMGSFVAKKGAYFEFDTLLPEWDNIIKITNSNTEANIQNNFREYDISCIAPEEVLRQTWTEILDDHPVDEAELRALSDVIDQKVLLDGTTVEGLMSMTTIEGKIEKLQMLIDRLKELADKRGVNYRDHESLVQESYNTSDTNKARSDIAKLYIVASQALSKYYGDVAFDNESFSALQEYMMKPGSIGNSSIRRVNYLLRKSIDTMRSTILDEYMPNAMQDIKKFYQDCNYSQGRNKAIGDQALMFKNLYQLDDEGNNLFMFKNPYDNTNDLKTHEREFLKKILYEFYKVRCNMRHISPEISSASDPKLLTDMPETYLYVPLQKASANTRRLDIRDNVTQWGKKVYRLITNPTEFFDEVAGFISKREVDDRDMAITQMRVYNPYTISETDLSERDKYIREKGAGYFETNVENIFIDFLSNQVRVDEFNKLLMRVKGIELALHLKGIAEGDHKDIEHTIKYIDDYVTLNVYNKSIMEKTSRQIDAWLQPLRRLVSTFYIGASPVAAVRDTLQGLQENFVQAAIKFQTDVNVEDVAFAYSQVFKDSLQDFTSMGKLNQFNIKYGFSNFDAANVAERLKSGRGGVLNPEHWMYWTLRAPDYLNRMTLFVAKLHHDGIWKAYSLDEEGRLKYNWRLDERFKAYAEGDMSDPQKYNEQKARYYSLIREFNQENPELQLGMADDLPDAYTMGEINAIKTLGESIYGAYDQSSKAKYENIAIGRNFAFFSTWMNGIGDNYFKTPQVTQSEVSLQQETDYNGKPLFFTGDLSGNTTTEDTGLPVSKHMPLMVQGIAHSFAEFFREFKSNDYSVKALLKSDAWRNPINRRNRLRAETDMGIAALLTMLFSLWLTPAYKTHKKESDGRDIFTNVMAEWMYKAGSASFDTFKGPMAIINYLGDSTNPATYKLQSKILNDAYNFVSGKKDFGQTIMGTQALLRSMQDSYRMYVRDAGTAAGFVHQ